MDFPNPSYEQQIGGTLMQGVAEKSFIDKTLAKSEVDEIKVLMQKEHLTRSDLLKLLYLMTSNETKLVNYDEWDRYLLGKFYTWIRQFVKIAEGFYDYEEYLNENKEKFNQETITSFVNSKNVVLHHVKFLADIYFYMSRSTLSLKAVAFNSILSNRFEYSYTGIPNPNAPEQKKGPLSFIFRK